MKIGTNLAAFTAFFPLYGTMRRLLASLSAVLFGLIVACPAPALDPARPVGEYSVSAWSMQDGLPHNLVHRIAQDRDGFLWVATWEGAARFNGRTFTRFDARSAAGSGIVGVRGLLPEDDGSMLFGTTQSGVLRYRAGAWDTLGGPDAQRLKVTTLVRDREGALWIGTEESLFRLDREDVLHAVGVDAGLEGNMVFSILALPHGELLVGTSAGLQRLRNGRFEPIGTLLGLPATNLRSLIARADGSVIASGDSGAWVIGPALDVARRLFDARVEALIEDRHGAIWLSTTASGLLRWQDGKTETIDRSAGLGGRGSSALFEDREGLVWVGSTIGLFRISDGPVHGIDMARGLGDNYVRTLVQTDDGTIWIGHSVGVDRWQDGRIENIDLAAHGLPPSSILALAPARGGGIWLGSYDEGVLRLVDGGSADDGAPRQLTREHGLPSMHVRALAETDDGSLWIGTTEGLARWRDGVMQRFSRNEGLPAEFVRALHEGADGSLWIGTSAGMARREPDGRMQTWRAEIDFPAFGVFDFLEDADGTLWIASDRGLLRLREGRFTRYDHTLGLPADTLFRVLDDGHGTLWLSSNSGLFGVRRSELDEIDTGARSEFVVDVIDHSDGMPSSQTNGGSSPAGLRAHDGRLWVPTLAGVAVVDPRVAGEPANAPVPVAFEKFVVDGEALAFDASHVLAPGTRRLVVGYAGINLRAAHDVRYRYRMIGFDERWLEAGTDTEAVFTNLPPGTYRFEVQAMLSQASWTRTSEPAAATIGFEIVAPFWRNAVFGGALGLLAVLALGGSHRWRVASLRKRERQLGEVIDLRTRELSEKHAALEQAHRQREDLLHRLAHLAHHDSLTGLPNRRAGDRHLLQAIASARATGSGLCIGLLDIDRFKRINDEHGHDAGDATLKMVADVLRNGLGEDGFATRHGGEEFMLSFTGLDQADAFRRYDALRERIAATPVHALDGAVLYCTVSIGLAFWNSPHDARSLLALADKRLYRAKQRGRDRVVAEERGID